jgi:penicillin-binding protein 1A
MAKKAKARAPRRRILQIVATAAVWTVTAVLLMVVFFALDLPKVDDALRAERRPSITLLAADGTEIGSYGDRVGRPLNLSELSPALPAAVLATEDRRFYDHFGLDVIGLGRATLANLRAGRIVQGGSTISQQVAKNLFLTPARSLKRKIQELLLALWLEQKFRKDQILTIYLNRVYLGAGTYGVDAAARNYFGKSARNLTVYQSAMLAGLLKAPSRYNPVANPDLAHKRTLRVLNNMVAVGTLSAAQIAQAVRRRGRIVDGRARNRGERRIGRYYAAWVLDQASTIVAGAKDLVITTTLDRRLQRLAEKAVAAVLKRSGKSAQVAQAALVSLATDGAVRAMVGGADFADSQFNRATQALRQPGSAFKPFVYLAGLEAGLTLDSRVEDAPLTIDGWSPRNFDGRYRGSLGLTEAFAQSVNTAAVRIAIKAGPTRVADAARRLGLTTDILAAPSLALGTSETSLLELTNAYSAFAGGGIGAWSYGISEIRENNGAVLYRRSGSGPGRVIAPKNARAMTAMLKAVIDDGTGKAARLERPAAGKTGTSQNFRDAWFIGFTADLITGVWMGNDDGGPMKRVTGGGLPAQIWKAYMQGAEIGLPARPLAAPPPAASVARATSERRPDVVPAQKGGFWSNIFTPSERGDYPDRGD